MMDLLPHWSPSEWINYGVMAAASAGVLVAFGVGVLGFLDGGPHEPLDAEDENGHIPGTW